jgi:hypothetical protein
MRRCWPITRTGSPSVLMTTRPSTCLTQVFMKTRFSRFRWMVASASGASATRVARSTTRQTLPAIGRHQSRPSAATGASSPLHPIGRRAVVTISLSSALNLRPGSTNHSRHRVLSYSVRAERNGVRCDGLAHDLRTGRSGFQPIVNDFAINPVEGSDVLFGRVLGTDQRRGV